MSPAATDGPVLSKLGIPNTAQQQIDAMDGGKLASPTDSENAEKNIELLQEKMNGSLKIDTDASGATKVAEPNSDKFPDFSSDPLSATATFSPLHTINWDSVQAFRPNRLDSINAIASTSLPASISNAVHWESFKRTGPLYPPSLEKLIMDYHHRHSKSWQLVHDMGAGSGVYSPVLAKYFRHVHISDPNGTGLVTSRKGMSHWAEQNKKSRGRFTFSNMKAEHGHDAVADRTVDMAIMMEGAHFTNPEAMVRSAAQSLAKDGTLALVSYSPICRITGNPGANDAIQRLFAAWGIQPWHVVCGDSRGQKQFSMGLDFVPLPEDLFDQSKTRRITINTQNKGSAAFQVPSISTPDASESKVHSAERRHDYSSENADDQASGWRQEVGPEFFRSLTAALVGGGATAQFEPHFKEIAKIIHETSPNGLMITVEWTVAILLATRK